MSLDLLALLSSYYKLCISLRAMISCALATPAPQLPDLLSPALSSPLTYHSPPHTNLLQISHHHHHHFPWLCISLQLPPISLCHFREYNFQRVPYSCGSPIPPLLLFWTHSMESFILGSLVGTVTPLMVSCLLTLPAIYMLMTLKSQSPGRPLC